jgi:glycosyltransferase involved in cell wall biosynthesis
MNNDFTKPKVLVFVDYYLPGFKSGGPVRTISNLVDHLGSEFRFLIVTRDRDILDAVPYPGIEIGGWNTVGAAQVFYAPPNLLSLRGIARLMSETEHDILYLNSFFSPRMTILPLFCAQFGLTQRKRCVIAPRGELAPSALTLKRAKKRVFLGVAKLLGLYRGVLWQASADHDAADIRREMGSLANDIRIALNLPRSTENLPSRAVARNTGDPLRVLFLARISPMKNLDFAVRVLGQVTARIIFDIYGPTEDATYWRECQDFIRQLPKNITVTYRGGVAADQVVLIFSTYDLFFFPTRGENYGHVIAESLSVGTPVLISDQTPWRSLQDDQLGWDLPLDDEKKFAKIIDDLALVSATSRCERSEYIKAKVVERLSDPYVLEANCELFRWALKRNN